MSEAAPVMHQWEQITHWNQVAPSLMAKVALFDAPNVEESDVDELTLWPEEAPAKTSRWLADVQDWMVNGADCSGTNAVSLLSRLPVGFCGRTSLALCPPTTARTSPPCCGDSPAADQPCPRTGGARSACASAPTAPPSGGCLTLAGSEWPNDAAVCSLSQVLEANVDPKYSLSPRAAAGILQRAQRRGKTLPARLEEALVVVAGRLTLTA
jgi:hypothetical protein